MTRDLLDRTEHNTVRLHRALLRIGWWWFGQHDLFVAKNVSDASLRIKNKEIHNDAIYFGYSTMTALPEVSR